MEKYFDGNPINNILHIKEALWSSNYALFPHLSEENLAFFESQKIDKDEMKKFKTKLLRWCRLQF